MDENGEAVWRLAADEFQGSMPNGELEGEIHDVRGEMFKDGETASRFSAPTGFFNQVEHTLSLKGGVRFDSEEMGIVLTATEIEYVEATGLIQAIGDVRIDSLEFGYGPADVLFMTPDLTWFGTEAKVTS
jgi:hypothetical protein